MSTAPEVLVASHCGMRVFGLSLITNKVVKSYEDNETVNHEAVLEVSKMRSETLQALVTELISRMDINNNTTWCHQHCNCHLKPHPEESAAMRWSLFSLLYTFECNYRTSVSITLLFKYLNLRFYYLHWS